MQRKHHYLTNRNDAHIFPASDIRHPAGNNAGTRHAIPESKIREYINHRKTQYRLKYTLYPGDNGPALQPGGMASP
ncbi:hypothetical protein [Burkholderia lata]|uniref:hypothetical protein n=1 Tax=Burkholderia lata (strain ATCC 17760 / DSM 23089 / LMG 22485 / NCIMB 9086 / R18194 / 383) TaxID=482957 RepID=UPI001583AC39|nr:hypothetical protein [Burkholderia lata]